MLKVIFTLLVLASACLAQSSSDKSFSVHHSKHADFSLSPAQMREAESLYRSACAVVQRDFHWDAELHPHFEVIIGASRDAVYSYGEITMKKWNPIVFAQGVVILAFEELLPNDVVKQLGERAVRNSNATVDVAGLK